MPTRVIQTQLKNQFLFRIKFLITILKRIQTCPSDSIILMVFIVSFKSH